MIVDMGRIEAGDGNAWEQVVEESGPRFSKLIEDERCAGHLGEDGEQAGAGRRLQHEIGGSRRGGEAGDKAERNRRRELLKSLALLGAAGVRGQQRRELAEHGKLRGWCDGTRPDGRAEFAQEQHLRGLAGVIGQLPAPHAFGVAAAERLLHGGAQRVRVNGAARFEMRQEEAGGAEQRRGRIRGGGCLMRRRNGCGDGRNCSDGSHGRCPGERERVRPAGGSL
jgi:hypothetical protein